MGRVGRVPARLGVLTILLFLSSLACQKDPESNDTAELIARAAQFNADSSRLAHDGDYRGAIVKAKAALIIWEKIPRSEELQANQRKVIQALEESSDAASFIDEVERLETEFQKHFDAGEYEKSIEYLQQQLAVLQKLPDTEALQIAQRERMRITEARIEKEEESNGIVDEALRDLMSTNPQNRLSAISFLAGAAEMELLGHYGSKVESILSRISREDTDQLLRAAAYEALQKFPGRSVESNTTPTESAQGQAITFLTGTKDFRSALAGFSEVQDPTNDPRKWSALLATASSEKRRCEESLGLDVRECAQFRALCLALDALDLVGFVVDKRESIGMEVATRKVEFGRNAANTLLADVEAYEAALSDLSERMLNDTVTAYKFMIERERSQIDELLGQTAPTSASRVVSQEDIVWGVGLM